MKSVSAATNFPPKLSILCAVAWVCFLAAAVFAAQPSSPRTARPATTQSPGEAKLFDNPQRAADALVDAAETFDVVTLTEIFGPKTDDIVFSGEFAQDRKRAADFAVEAREKRRVSMDPKNGNRAFLLVGNEDD